jgi:hypothetical protein
VSVLTLHRLDEASLLDFPIELVEVCQRLDGIHVNFRLLVKDVIMQVGQFSHGRFARLSAFHVKRATQIISRPTSHDPQVHLLAQEHFLEKLECDLEIERSRAYNGAFQLTGGTLLTAELIWSVMTASGNRGIENLAHIRQDVGT